MSNQEPWILTHTGGRRINLQNPRPEDVHIEDIAYALSRTPRFTGHSDPSWTVGQHLLYCSRLVARNYGSHALQLAALVHDFPEAYLGDVSAPLKRCVLGYRELEWLHEAAIEVGLGLDVLLLGAHKMSVKAIDQRAFEVDVQLCMPKHPDLPEMAPPSMEEQDIWYTYRHQDQVEIQEELIHKFCLLVNKLKGGG